MTKESKKATPLNPSLPPETIKYLQRLTKTGVHGKTPSEVARVLIWDQIKALIREGVIKWEKDADNEQD
jgi:hypothetical protein